MKAGVKAAVLGTGLLLTGSALAADLPSRKDVAPPPPPVFTWTGLYIGFNAGYTWNASDPITLSSVNVIDESIRQYGPASALGASGTVPARLNGFMFGGQIGYNWQFSDRYILGFEGDIVGMGVRGGNGQRSIYPASDPGRLGNYVGTSWKTNRQLEFLSTMRARLGYAITPSIMGYVTGGFAFGGANLSGAVSQSLRPGPYLADTVRGDRYDVLTGWTVGAGAEMALTRNISSKIEYLYYDLGQLWLANPSLHHENLITGAVVADATSAHARYNGHILRAGLNYRFDSTVPESGSAATPLFAAPRFAEAERAAYGDWKMTVMPYVWAVNFNGTIDMRNKTLGTDVTILDALGKSASFPAIGMGRVEIENGPFWAYGDVAWAQLRFAGSTLSLRSPIADVSVAASASARMKLTLGIGEAGFGYELGRWKLMNASSSVTSLDAYVGTRYVNQTVQMNVDALFAVTSPYLLGIERVGGRSVLGTGTLWWFDPVVGLRMRHSTAPGSAFEMRGDIGGFGAGSKFSWQFFGGYHADFKYNNTTFTTLVGYRALGLNYSKWAGGYESGMNNVIHGPLIGAGLKF